MPAGNSKKRKGWWDWMIPSSQEEQADNNSPGIPESKVEQTADTPAVKDTDLKKDDKDKTTNNSSPKLFGLFERGSFWAMVILETNHDKYFDDPSSPIFKTFNLMMGKYQPSPALKNAGMGIGQARSRVANEVTKNPLEELDKAGISPQDFHKNMMNNTMGRSVCKVVFDPFSPGRSPFAEHNLLEYKVTGLTEKEAKRIEQDVQNINGLGPQNGFAFERVKDKSKAPNNWKVEIYIEPRKYALFAVEYNQAHPEKAIQLNDNQRLYGMLQYNEKHPEKPLEFSEKDKEALSSIREKLLKDNQYYVENHKSNNAALPNADMKTQALWVGLQNVAHKSHVSDVEKMDKIISKVLGEKTLPTQAQNPQGVNPQGILKTSKYDKAETKPISQETPKKKVSFADSETAISRDGASETREIKWADKIKQTANDSTKQR